MSTQLRRPRVLVPFTYRLVFTFCFLAQHLTKADWLRRFQSRLRLKLANHLRLAGVKGEEILVDSVTSLDVKDFHKNYVKPGLPVLIKGGCQSWPCSSKWNFKYLEDEYGEAEFNLASYRGFVPLSENETPDDISAQVNKRASIKEMIQSMGEDNSIYMRFCPIMEEYQDLIDDLDKGWIKKMAKSYLGFSYQSFMGGANKKTPIHAGMTAFFFVLPFGKKKWTLFPNQYDGLIHPAITRFAHNFSDVDISAPNLDNYPGFDCLDRYVCEMEEGDILYVPAWLWHEVENHTNSWGVSVRIPHLFQAWKQSFGFTFKRYFFTRPSVFTATYLSFFNKVSKRDKYLMTPKIFK